jgi:hypothetical protein
MSSSSVNDHSSLTIDIRPLLEDVSQLMTKHISRMLEGVVGEYTTYKETHDIIMSLPCVQKLQSKVSYLEMQLQSNTHNNGHVDIIQEQTTNDRTQSQSSASSSDYNEVLKLKLAIDELTKYIHQLESAQATTKPAAASTPTVLKAEDSEEICDIHDSETEAVRLEIRENDQSSNDDSDGSNNEDEDECDKNTKNEIVAVNIVRADEIVDGADEEEEEEEEEEEVDAEEEDAQEEDAQEEEEEDEAVDAEDEDAGAEEDVEAEEEAVEDVDAEDEEDAAVEEDEIEVSEIKIKGKTYFTTNSKNGIIYACVNDDVGDEVGVFKNGIALFNTKK